MWYISAALKPVGPLSLLDLTDKIKKGQLGLFDLVFNEETNEWRPAQDWPELRHVGFPALEAVGLHSAEEAVWVVLHQEPETKLHRQEGPFSAKDIEQEISGGRLSREDLVWKKGLSGWARLNERPEFFIKELETPQDLNL